MGSTIEIRRILGEDGEPLGEGGGELSSPSAPPGGRVALSADVFIQETPASGPPWSLEWRWLAGSRLGTAPASGPGLRRDTATVTSLDLHAGVTPRR